MNISIYDKMLLYSSENLFAYHFSPPESLTEEELTGFRTSLREVFTFIKYSQNKDKIDILLRENNAYEFLDRSAVNVLKN